MSRSGYSEDGDYDQWATIRWRGAVASAMKGKKGQAFFKELLAALDALPKKRLVTQALETEGSYCTLGALGKARELDMSKVDPEDYEAVARLFGINEKLVQETVWYNDEVFDDYTYKNGIRVERTPEERWEQMRAWIVSKIK